MIIRVSVVLSKTVLSRTGFDNLSGSYLQSEVNCGTSVDGINVSGR